MGVLRRTQRRRQSVEPRTVRGWGPAGRKQDPKSQKFSLKDSLELAELLLSSALRVSARFPPLPCLKSNEALPVPMRMET